MPKIGQEPIRRDALVKATIAEVGEVGSLAVTVSQIARRAGMSSALAHHYFGGKSQILLAAMRELLKSFGTEVRSHVAQATTPRRKVEAIVRAAFDEACFKPEVVAAWLQFYVQAQHDPEAQRLLRVYHRRLHSNLVSSLRPISATPRIHAEVIGALIDGVYIRQALKDGALGGDEATAIVLATLDTLLGPVQ